MRILVVVHQFLPKQSAGTEVYSYKLAKALQARGHELSVFYTERDPDRPSYELTRGEFDGLPYHEVVHNHDFADYREVYKNERMEAHLRTVLDEVRPDLVHVQHLHLHSIGYLGILHGRGIPIVYTLAEYLNICPRSWLVKLDFSLCEGPEPSECARCSVIWPPPRPEGAPARAPVAPVAPGPKPRYSLRRFLGKLRRRLVRPAYRPAVERRWREISEELAHVDLFVAPSRFLLERFVETGMVDRERIVHSDYGFDHAPFEGLAPRERSGGPLRVGFIGSIEEQKGVHLLVEACRRLDPSEVECVVHGDLSGKPDYAERVLRAARGANVRFPGRYDNTRIGEVLAALDVLVVPSRWFENSPLTIHEAFMAGVPVVTGDRGGMAELVQHEVSGLHFRIGDAKSLRAALERLVLEPDLLERLRAGIPAVKTIAEDAAETEARFEALLGGARSGRGGGGAS